MTSGKVLRSLQITFAIVAVAVIQARADIIDLGGETVAITTDNGLNTYNNHEVRNGVLNVSAKQGFADGTFGVDKNCTRGQIVTFLYRIK